jgi:hypothetical protein
MPYEPNPQIASIYPNKYAVNISLLPTITVAYDKAIDATSVDTASILLVDLSVT